MLLVTVEKTCITAGVPTLCFKKVWKLRQVLNVSVTAGTGGARWVGALSPFLSKVTKKFRKTESKFLNSRVLAGGFVMGCAKKSWF